jgi:hypothetical protein
LKKSVNNKNEIKQFFEERKNLNHEELFEDIKKAFEDEERKKQDERNDLKEFAESLGTVNAKERAYKFIKYYYNKYSTYFGEDEFLVLLISRGLSFKEFQGKQHEVWKNKSVELNKKTGFSTFNSETKEKKVVRYIDNKNLFEQDVSKTPHYEIPNFWSGRRNEFNTIDATMLRVVQWCKLSGFEGYWKRLIQDVEINVPFDIQDKFQRIQWMYSMCRCEYAIELMYNKLSLLIEILIIHEDHRLNHVWEFIYYHPQTLQWEVRNSPFIAAGLMFIVIRLGKKEQYLQFVQEAKEYLIKSQTQEGGWRRFSNDENNSIETTALCIHSLALLDLENLSYIIQKGVECLYNSQDVWGLWFEDKGNFVSSEYLTALVLDAIEISEGNLQTLTFQFTYTTEGLSKGNHISNSQKIYYVQHMGDKYHIEGSQVGAVGREAMAESNTFQQINHSIPKNFDFELLSSELEKLKNALKDKAEQPEEFTILSNIASAEKASREKNYGKVVEYLKIGGKWVFDTAKDIGVSVVAEIINKQIQ